MAKITTKKTIGILGSIVKAVSTQMNKPKPARISYINREPTMDEKFEKIKARYESGDNSPLNGGDSMTASEWLRVFCRSQLKTKEHELEIAKKAGYDIHKSDLDKITEYRDILKKLQ